jgi:hypothetical protein
MIILFIREVEYLVKIAVIDGMGGGLGAQISNVLNGNFSEKMELIGLGTNAHATSNMLSNGADRGATGENAIKVTSSKVDVIVGPLGIIIPNSMHGEITPVMAEAVADSEAKKFLIGIKQPHVEVVGSKDISINEMIKEVVEKVRLYI